MKNKIINLLVVLFLLIGIGVLTYPFVSNTLHDNQQNQIITEYDETIEQMEAQEKAALRDAAAVYNKTLLGNVVLTDPFDASAAEESSDEYLTLLNVDGDGIMGYIEIPRIGVYEAIYHGTSEEVLAKGIGHLEQTSLPVGGESTHAVLSGHTGLPEAELFTNLTEVVEGDLFFLHILDETLAYEVDQIKIVDPSDTTDLMIEAGKDYVTLVTCTPYGVNSHRLLVRGHRVEYTEEVEKVASSQAEEGAGQETWKTIYIKSLLLGLGLAIAALVLLALIRRWLSRRKEHHMDGGRS